ncbi:unnamed protein product [Protopolystoma xenopodis]|uniref:Uncharacterized protein n=1 Tax=Protopolystoma xenopodis TaxID=117903 RepID=A0A3S5AKL5_9PLAT|nr:unnamed protein product [Protopolystoma xenopodis]
MHFNGLAPVPIHLNSMMPDPPSPLLISTSPSRLAEKARSDKISSIMGKYLLKGNKSGDVCPRPQAPTEEAKKSQFHSTSLPLCDKILTQCPPASGDWDAASSNELMDVIRRRVRWCVAQLNDATSPNDIQQWAEAIRNVSEAWSALHKCMSLG